MGVATSLFVIAIGAILSFAVHVTTSHVNVVVVGYILMAFGFFGLVLSVALWESLLGGPTHRRPMPPPRRRAYPPDEAPTRRF